MATLNLNSDYGLSENDLIDNPLSSALNDASAGDTITVDAGTYRFQDFDNGGKAVSIVGGDVVLEMDTSSAGGTFTGGNWTVDGFGFDTHSNALPAFSLRGSGWTWTNCVFWNTDRNDDDQWTVNPRVPSGGTATISNTYWHEGHGSPGEFVGGKPILAFNDQVKGELIIDSVWVEAWGENTFYLANNSGKITVKNSYFKNTTNAVRVTSPALIQNTVITVEDEGPCHLNDNGNTTCAKALVWWNAEKGRFTGDVEILDCNLRHSYEPHEKHLIDATDGQGGSLIVRRTNIQDDVSFPWVKSENHPLVFDDVSVTGTDVNRNIDTTPDPDDVHSERAYDGTPPLPSPPTYPNTPSGGGGGGDDTATPPSFPVIDDFNEESLDWWRANDLNVWGFTTTTVQEGSALKHTGSWGRLLSEPSQTTTLNNYFSKGERSKIDVYRDNTSRSATVSFAAVDSANRYIVHLDYGGGETRLYYYDGSTTENLLDRDTSAAPAANTWYEVDIIWDDGTLGGADNDITVAVTDKGTGEQLTKLSANDSTHATNSGLWLDADAEPDTGNFTVFDNWRQVAAPYASNVTVIDDWEDGDIAGWSGDTAVFSAATDNVYRGTYSLKHSGGFGRIFSLPGDGLNHYFKKGEKMKVYINRNNLTNTSNIGYGYKGDDARYNVIFDYGNDEIRHYKQTPNASGEVQLDTIFSPAGLSSSTWYEVDIVWDDGTLGGSEDDHTVTITDTSTDSVLHTFNGNDAEFATESGMQLASVGNENSGEATWFDFEHMYTEAVGGLRKSTTGVLQTTNGVIDTN